MSDKTIAEIRQLKTNAEQVITNFVRLTVQQFEADTGLKATGMIMVRGAQGELTHADIQIDFNL